MSQQMLLVVVALTVIVGAITLIMGFLKLTRGGRNRTSILLAITVALSAMLATFGASFSILDALLVDLQVESFDALNKSKLVLKVSIILIAVKLFTSLFKLYNISGILKTIREDLEGQHVFSKKEFKKLTVAEWDEKLAKTVESKARFLFTELRNFSQLAFFQSVSVILLIQFLSQETADFNGEMQKESIFFAIANWALFFVLDDWNIMHDYSQKMKGNILKNHKRKIWGINLILLISCPLLLFALFNMPGSSASSNDLPFVFFFAVVLIATYYWRTYLDFNKYIEEPKKKKGAKEATQTA